MKMKNRKVWGIGWRLSDGSWMIRKNISFVEGATMFSYLWVAGVREMGMKRLGV